MARARAHIEEDEADRILLISANEDYTGLYEAIWEFNTRFPNTSLGEKYSASERALRSLHSRGLIEFHRMVFTDDYKNHHFEPIDPGTLEESSPIQ